MIELEDMIEVKFTEGDYVMFADSNKSLRIAKVRGIKPIHGGNHKLALEIVVGMAVTARKYSRRYYPHDFYKVDYTTTEE